MWGNMGERESGKNALGSGGTDIPPRPPDKGSAWAAPLGDGSQRLSFAAVVSGKPIEPRFPEISLPNKTYGRKEGVPVITFSTAEYQAATKRFDHSLIAKFQVGRPSLPEIKDFMAQNWRVQGKITISSIWDDRHLVIILDSDKDASAVLASPLRRIGHTMFRLFRWTPHLSATKEETKTTKWIRLPGLPLELFDKAFIRSIINSFAVFVDIDDRTKTLTGLKFARACIEVDVLEVIPDRVWINLPEGKSFFQAVVVEGNNEYCSKCSKHGHVAESCWKGVPRSDPGRPAARQVDVRHVPRLEVPRPVSRTEGICLASRLESTRQDPTPGMTTLEVERPGPVFKARSGSVASAAQDQVMAQAALQLSVGIAQPDRQPMVIPHHASVARVTEAQPVSFPTVQEPEKLARPSQEEAPQQVFEKAESGNNSNSWTEVQSRKSRRKMQKSKRSQSSNSASADPRKIDPESGTTLTSDEVPNGSQDFEISNNEEVEDKSIKFTALINQSSVLTESLQLTLPTEEHEGNAKVDRSMPLVVSQTPQKINEKQAVAIEDISDRGCSKNKVSVPVQTIAQLRAARKAQKAERKAERKAKSSHLSNFSFED